MVRRSDGSRPLVSAQWLTMGSSRPLMRRLSPGVKQLDNLKATMAKITGIGGVFFKCKGDTAALRAWYKKHLGMQLKDFGGAVLKWPEDKAEDLGLTVWHLADKDSQVINWLTRLLILLHKLSQDTTRKVYMFVPTQEWTRK